MKRSLLILAMGLLAQFAMAAPGTMLKDEELKSAPSTTAAIVSSVSKGSTVEVLERQGGWTRIQAGAHTGWVRILSVRTSVSTGGVGDLAALASRRDSSQVVAVAGLRGLNEEELKGAKFSPEELTLLNSFLVKPAEARNFARAANLEQRKVPYLPKPQAASSGNTGSGFFGE